MTKDHNLLIKGRRWFQASYGNTYHSVEIIDMTTVKQIAYEPFEYGYNNQYLQTAVEMLAKLKIEVTYNDLCHDRHGIQCTVYDVKRKKDL